MTRHQNHKMVNNFKFWLSKITIIIIITVIVIVLLLLIITIIILDIATPNYDFDRFWQADGQLSYTSIMEFCTYLARY
jgi:hypothetical protein